MLFIILMLIQYTLFYKSVLLYIPGQPLIPVCQRNHLAFGFIYLYMLMQGFRYLLMEPGYIACISILASHTCTDDTSCS